MRLQPDRTAALQPAGPPPAALLRGPRAIRANAVSAGPIKTLSAVGIGDFHRIISHVEEMAPLRRNVDADEVADAVTFMLSDKARGITGTVIYVDAGYHAMGL